MSLHVRFSISEDMISLERSRQSSSMSKDDLLWCFGGQAQFVDRSNRVLLELDASLLGLACDLIYGVIDAAREGAAIIGDREGSYSLSITVRDRAVHIGEDATSEAFEVGIADLTAALDDYAHRLCSELERLFPAVARNPNFQALNAEIERSVATLRRQSSLGSPPEK